MCQAGSLLCHEETSSSLFIQQFLACSMYQHDQLSTTVGHRLPWRRGLWMSSQRAVCTEMSLAKRVGQEDSSQQCEVPVGLTRMSIPTLPLQGRAVCVHFLTVVYSSINFLFSPLLLCLFPFLHLLLLSLRYASCCHFTGSFAPKRMLLMIADHIAAHPNSSVMGG